MKGGRGLNERDFHQSTELGLNKFVQIVLRNSLPGNTHFDRRFQMKQVLFMKSARESSVLGKKISPSNECKTFQYVFNLTNCLVPKIYNRFISLTVAQVPVSFDASEASLIKCKLATTTAFVELGTPHSTASQKQDIDSCIPGQSA